jgi:YbgC/YbaW family acyl-CoA thioester hydrolase
MSDFNYRLPIQIRFADLSFLGHVNSAVYQIYYVQAGVYYFDNVLWQKSPVEDEAIMMASITIDYLQPIFYNSSIAVETRIAAIGHKSFQHSSRVIDLNRGAIYSQARSTSVCFSRSRQKSIPIPELWRRRILAFEKIKPEDAKQRNSDGTNTDNR